MECFTHGVLTTADIGFAAPFGDAQAMVRLTEMIARRQGFGDVLANGSRKAAEMLGKGQQNLITVKGAEAPAHMPQSKRSLGLIYAVNPFGADHQSSEHDPMVEDGAADLYMGRLKELGFDKTIESRSLGPDKVRFAFKGQQFYSFLDSACLCQFVWGPAWTLYGPTETVEFVRAATGWQDFTLDELLAVGERRINMMRAMNARLGLDRKADALPEKFFTPLTGEGPTAGISLSHDEIQSALEEYYRQAEWEPQSGNPTTQGLARLGLSWILETEAKPG
jgi:aldehyde:ferredoxin oxidoreductase